MYFWFQVIIKSLCISDFRLLVGSPKLSRPGDNDPNTGGLYKCSFNSWCDEKCDLQVQAEAGNYYITINVFLKFIW